MKIIRGLTYITPNYIVKCNKSSEGYIIENGKIKYTPKSVNDTYLDENDNSQPYFEIIEPYIRGKFYKGITTNFVSNSSLYDAKTHYYLGEYLRMIRDLDGINLMPYYNC